MESGHSGRPMSVSVNDPSAGSVTHDSNFRMHMRRDVAPLLPNPVHALNFDCPLYLGDGVEMAAPELVKRLFPSMTISDDRALNAAYFIDDHG